ncbi:lysyl oxidase homolog 2-like [Stylophora pistillata]|uniref:lysyl oxidase homolog 2-like n=1 Tax=Stylophora pistillata TaxID=50429 RepID=UPI000C056B18|nr:lysyl oxidase homolog 2-like [Stylophora pistillata]
MEGALERKIGLLLTTTNSLLHSLRNVSFTGSYSKSPSVLLTAKHSTSGGNAAAECNGIVGWIEFITTSGFRICVKEVFVNRFDPLTVSYAVLADICLEGWAYYKGYCYRRISSCDSWSGSQATCATLGASLPSIHSQEENVYIQSLHGGDHSWLGLSDRNTEGTFVWSDGSQFNFHYWASHQPNNFHDEDCVHTLGVLKNHKYRWNDVNCSDCHKFTCKKDYNECKDFAYDCPVNATCVNNVGSYSCQCPAGFRLNGRNCTDIDECSSGSFSCHSRGQCVNIPGSYDCKCLPGYVGDGKTNCEAPRLTASSSCVLSKLTRTSGYFRITQFGSQYSNNMDCRWNFSSNTKIELVFHSFSTESSIDFVSVYDGGSVSSPLIRKMSGSSLPPPITSSSNNLYVKFSSDGTNAFDGFQATYRVLTAGSIRISGNTAIGRIEVYYDGQWGTVCDDAWDINDANVVCRQLGYTRAKRAYSGATHGQGTGPIWMDDLACSGSESHVYDCRHRGWGNHDCTHSRDASVECLSIRLANGGANYGRMEVYHNGQWGTVCDDSWDMNDADVVCRELGFPSASSAPHRARYGQGSDPIWMDNVRCRGDSSLLNCAHNGWGSHNCGHGEDASVICNT